MLNYVRDREISTEENPKQLPVITRSLRMDFAIYPVNYKPHIVEYEDKPKLERCRDLG